MRIREFEAKEILKTYGIPVPKGMVLRDRSDLQNLTRGIQFPVVAKAQVTLGKRGKSGGIKLARTEKELLNITDELLGRKIIQTGSDSESEIVEALLIEEFVEHEDEFYLGITVDRKISSVSAIVGKRGGIDVEEEFSEDPKNFLVEEIDIRYGLPDYKARKFFSFLGLSSDFLDDFVRLLKSLYKIFTDCECILCEINPLAFSEKRGFVALDAKMILDDNALFRHRDSLSEFGIRVEERSLSYVRLKGNVGIIANGAGLAMATMDLVKMVGMEPANFLDVGGGAKDELIAEGIKVVHDDPQCEVIFANIFGGILRCDTFARGLLMIYPEIKKPFIVRLSGTNRDEALKLLKEKELSIHIFTELGEAVETLAKVARDVSSC